MARQQAPVPAGPCYPQKRRGSEEYYPVIPAFCMLIMIIAVGVWVHYTRVTYNNLQAMGATLGDVVMSENALVSRVFDGMISTAIIFLILGGIVVGMALWRPMLEIESDMQGEIPDTAVIFKWSSFGVQIAWGIFMMWMVLLLAGDAVMTAYVSVAVGSFTETIMWRQLVSEVPDPVNPATCPANCMDINALDFMELTTLDQSLGCICDAYIILAAYEMCDDAYKATSGVLAGIIMMYLGGLGLQLNMLYSFGLMSKELDLEGRLGGDK